MTKLYTELTAELKQFIHLQHMFFVATAPLAESGHINLSPKGMHTFCVVGGNQVAYLDLTGGDAETIAHLRENGRIVVMFCAFDESPKILRLHGNGTVHQRSSTHFQKLRLLFDDEFNNERAIITIELDRISSSCGFGVPRYEFMGERENYQRYADHLTHVELQKTLREKNHQSIDGLPGYETPE